jgi:hypothetical protein
LIAAGGTADLIITSSTAAVRYLEGFQVYSATKAYLAQLSRLLRMELGRNKVRVSTIEPGMVNTELPDHVTDPSASKLMADLIQQIDVLTGEDIAETVAFLASLPKHVNLTEIHILPTEQVIRKRSPLRLHSWSNTPAAQGRGDASARQTFPVMSGPSRVGDWVTRLGTNRGLGALSSMLFHSATPGSCNRLGCPYKNPTNGTNRPNVGVTGEEQITLKYWGFLITLASSLDSA